MSTGKPSADGHIINLSWDNTGGWDNQLAVTTGNLPHIEVRGQNSGTWGNWCFVEARTNLYNNTSGATGTITLSQTAANFTYIDIFYRTDDNEYGCTRVFSPNGKTANLSVSEGRTNNRTYVSKVKDVTISGTSIATSSKDGSGTYRYAELLVINGGDHIVDLNNKIYITRVDGYK